ncbi:hypothetical protein ACU4HD_02920 [Cupriavidus basilensis]
MTLDEAFDVLEGVPVEKRLLMGQPDGDDIDWTPDHIDNFPVASRLGVDIAEPVCRFLETEGRQMVMLVEAVAAGFVVLALGPASREAVEESFGSLAR